MAKRFSSQAVLLVCMVCVLLSFSACGGQEEPAAVTEVPTSSVTDTPFPTRRFAQPTSVITVAVTETPASAQTADLDRGKGTYESKGCADCHGAQGAGVDGKGEGLAGTQLTEKEFDDILRTGGAGELGNEHLYGPQAISPSGMQALYAYVKSLSAP